MLKHQFSILFFLFSVTAFSQTKIFTGVVTDSLNVPLESANVLARPVDNGGTFKFAIADNRGRYRLELDKGFGYEISVSYLGYTPQNIIIEKDSELSEYNFRLKSTGIEIEEIVITHKYEPVIIKKDTLNYDEEAYASGNERKMKE